MPTSAMTIRGASSILIEYPVLNLPTGLTKLSAAQTSGNEFNEFKRNDKVTASFTKQRQIQSFLKLLVSKKKFFVGEIRREVSKAIFREIMEDKGINVVEEYKAYQYKSDGMDVETMYWDNPEVFGHGNETLPNSSHKLRVDRLLEYHRASCTLCATSRNRVHTDCYFTQLIKCITNGWKPKFTKLEFQPLYKCDSNYESTANYPGSVTKEINSMLENGVIQKCQYSVDEVIHPIGAIVKGSDKTRAMALLGILVTNQESLDKANKELLARHLNKIKVRVATDCSGTGVNSQAVCPRFSYPSFREAVRIINRGCWLGLVDIGRYFNSFPWSADMRKFMRFKWQDNTYEFLGLCFGFSVCPYYCSTWSAEFRRWMLAKRMNCTHMVDDWLFVENTREKAVESCEHMAEILMDCGFYMATEKNEYGQTLKYLGVFFDTNSMTMRIDHVQALGTRLMLETCLQQLRIGKGVAEATMRHLAGKLNWFSELLQSGQLHIRSFWDYLRVYSARAVPNSVILSITADMVWWIEILRTWEQEGNHKAQYRILSSTELLDDPYAIYYIQSDASGEDGYGYFHGFYHEEDLQYASFVWNHNKPSSSHAMELSGLKFALLTLDTTVAKKILVWVTDSTSAALTVNKASCKNAEGFQLLSDILLICDGRQLELVALWTPREENILADYLSHLASILGRSSDAGRLSQI